LIQKDHVIYKTNTDENGNYQFLYVNPGEYDIRATKYGYRTSIIIHVPISANRTIKNDFYLPKFNTVNMQSNPIVDEYANNCKKYMRQHKKG
jgi:hypothetical protein